MKKILLAFLLMAGLLLTACNGKIEGKITVNIYDSEAKITTQVVEIKKDSNLLEVLKADKELSIVYEEGQIKSIKDIELQEGFKWQVYLNDVLVDDLVTQKIKDKDVVNFKQEDLEEITVNVYEKGKDVVIFNVPLNGKTLVKEVLTSYSELKFVVVNNKITSLLDITLQEGSFWQVKKNDMLVTDINLETVTSKDVINLTLSDYDDFDVIVHNIDSTPYTKKVYLSNLNGVIDILRNDIDISLEYKNSVIESVKNITLTDNYKWVIYLNEVVVNSLDNITIKPADVLKFKVEEIATIAAQVYNGDVLIYEATILTNGSLNLLSILTSYTDLEFSYSDGVIKYVRSIFPKNNYKWEVSIEGVVIEDLENYEVTANDAIKIQLVYVPIIVEFEVTFNEVEFRVGNVIRYQISIISGPILGANVTSSNSEVLEVDGLNLIAHSKGEATILIEIGDSKQSLIINVEFKRYEDMTDEEYLALTPEEQDEVWEEHLTYQAELRHLEVLRILESVNDLPAQATEDLDIILGTAVQGVWVTWETNEPGVISILGKVSKTTSDVVVTLTLTVRSTEESFSVSKDIFVEGFVMEPLPDKNLTFAYLPSYGWQGIREADIPKLDVINFQAGTIGANSQLIIGTKNIFFELLKLREKGVRIVICVYGGSWFGGNTDFEDMAINPVTRALFVQSVVEQIELYDFDGIDLDWEIPSVINAKYFTALVRDLREAFDAINPNLIISAAVPNSNYTSNFEYDKIGQYMSHLHLMNYDMGWKERTSHNSVLYSGGNNTYADISVDRTVNTFVGLGFPKEKIVIGSAFYGKIYKNVFTTGSGLGVTVTGDENKGTTINYHNIYNDYLKVNPQFIRRDEVGHADYYYDNIKGIFISYESIRVMREKTNYVIDNELAGIMFWDYNHDQTGDLLNAIYQTYPTRIR